jgi:two-component system response regulator HydG
MTWYPLAFHRFRDALRRAETGRAAGRFREAIEAFTEAMVVRGGDLTSDQEADLRNRIALCYLDLGEIDAAELAIEPIAGLDRARILPSTRGATSFVRGRIALTRGDYAATVRHATEAWETLRNTGENSLVARALNVRGHGHRQLGNVEQAREDYTDALAAARRAGDDHETGLASSNLGFLLWLSGRYDEARAFHRRAVEIHEACGSEPQLSRELHALAVDELHAGDWKQCEALLLRARERAEQAEDRRLLSATAILKARLEHARGEDPRETLEAAARTADAEGYEHDRIVIGQLLGDAALERGDWPEARRVLAAALDRARQASPEGEPAASTAWRLALALEAAGDPDGNVLELLGFARSTAAGHGYAACEAAARRATAEVLANRGRTDEARDHAQSAVDLFRGLAMPYELGRSRTVLARLCAHSVTDVALAAPLFREAAGVLSALGARRDAAHAEEGLAEVSGEAVAAAKDGAGAAEPFTEIVTGSPDMAEAIQRSRRIAPSDIPVLITGETGTGKELFARSIHGASKRRERPFLAVNCAALTETLLEAELFGHVKGAFTGAMSAKAGIFEAANGGTVFLDEVGKAPASLQAKLLRVLDTGEVRRVGGVEAIHVNVRIVAATNRNLPEAVDRGEFLPDLLYRLRGYEIRVPALRERAGDVALLFEHFAGRPATESALDVLEQHDWPGNVREIRNLAESAAFLTLGRGPIPLDALPEWIRSAADEDAPHELSAHVTDSERQALVRALMRCGGNRSAAARRLGISRQTLYTKMQKYGIDGRVEAA